MKKKERISGFERASNAAIKIQSLYRGYLERKHILLQKRSATKIQTKFRKYQRQKRSQKYTPILKEHIEIDQKLKITRDRLVREEREYQIMSMLSGSRLKTYEDLLREKASVIVQKYIRKYLAKIKVEKIRTEMKFLQQSSLDSSTTKSVMIPKWGSELDGDSKNFFVFTKYTMKESQIVKTRIMDKLLIERTKNSLNITSSTPPPPNTTISSPIKNRSNPFDEMRSINTLNDKDYQSKQTITESTDSLSGSNQTTQDLIEKIQFLDKKLDEYYIDIDQLKDLTPLEKKIRMLDLSLGCNRVRSEVNQYSKQSIASTVNFETMPYNLPIPHRYLKKIKNSHHNFKYSLSVPWWISGGLSKVMTDGELMELVADADVNSSRIY